MTKQWSPPLVIALLTLKFTNALRAAVPTVDSVAVSKGGVACVFQVSVLSLHSHRVEWMAPPELLLEPDVSVTCRRSCALVMGCPPGLSTCTRKYARWTALLSPSSSSGFWVPKLVVGLAWRTVTSAVTVPTGQTGVPPPPHTPAVQNSPPVHALLSLHAEPLALVAWPHAPVLGVHVPVWHESEAGHTLGFEPMQTPPWQTSVSVQALLSLQEAVLTSCTQALLTQRSEVQGLPSSHCAELHSLPAGQS